MEVLVIKNKVSHSQTDAQEVSGMFNVQPTLSHGPQYGESMLFHHLTRCDIQRTCVFSN